MHERFKSILVTTDFSEVGDHAINHAFRMAADHGAKVVLCHVVEVPMAPVPLYAQYYPPDMLTPDLEKQIKEEAQRALLERVPSDGELSQVAHEALVIRGLPSEEIVQTAKEIGADLIVISTHGHAGLKHVLLGSVAERVVRHAACPVLVVR
jgi:nucleotide-binding universal stress UspA family protein